MGQRCRLCAYSEAAINTGRQLRLIFGGLWRQIEGVLRSITTLLGLSFGVPHPYPVDAARPWAGAGQSAGARCAGARGD